MKNIYLIRILFFVNLISTCLVINAVGQAPSVQKEFDDASGNFYNYCPSYIQTSSTERYIYYCKNLQSDIIRDHIYWRKATLSGSTWSWGQQQVALAPVGSGWDSYHICDPDVKKGSFLYNGTTYGWVMFYLGTDTYTTHNQIGVAFANSPEGPWVKYGGNPIVTYPNSTWWGVGQPSATSIDGAGRLLLFYTRGDENGTRQCRAEVNMANMANFSKGTEYTLFTSGLTPRSGSGISFHNVGFAYDGGTDRFYIVREREPNDGDDPNFISTDAQVAYTAGANIWNNSGSWTVEGNISPIVSGKPRNHNAALLTDQYGGLAGGSNNYQVEFTGSQVGTGNLWTYRIYKVAKGDLNYAGNLPAPGLIYTLTPKHDQDNRLHEAGNVPGGDARSLTANSSNRQQWKLIDDGGGYFQLEPQSDIGKRLDVSGAGTIAGTDVAVWHENGNNAQKWRLIDVGGGWYELEAKNAPGLRLDVSGAGTGADVNVYLWTQNGNDAQKWKFTQVGSPAQLDVDEITAVLKPASILPNPVKGELILQFTPRKNNRTVIQLYAIGGQLLRSFQQNTNFGTSRTTIKLSTAGLSSGMYIVRFEDANGIVNKKIMVK